MDLLQPLTRNVSEACEFCLVGDDAVADQLVEPDASTIRRDMRCMRQSWGSGTASQILFFFRVRRPRRKFALRLDWIMLRLPLLLEQAAGQGDIPASSSAAPTVITDKSRI